LSPGSAKGSSPEAIERAVRIGQLIDLYGPLLTERQRNFITLHYVEDMSFGEIAQEYGISRQAIHDAVKHAEQALEDYDRKLRIAPEDVRRETPATAPEEAPTAESAEGIPPEDTERIDGLEPSIQALEQLSDRLKRSGGVIYNADSIRREIDTVLENLRRLNA
jgi:predicted DNA-binding protein YlxM (UPF0122 family)